MLALREFITRFIYKKLLRPLIFLWSGEVAHNKLKAFGLFVGGTKIGRLFLRALCYYQHKSLNTRVDGIDYKNPVGLSAGFDKDGELTHIYPALGFGFAELGSFTGEVCPGNPGVGRRLFRMIKSRSILVWYGLNNKGAIAISRRLKDKKFKLPIGINAAKTNSSTDFVLENSIQDYVKTVEAFNGIGSYLDINISCPNTQDKEPFVDVQNLRELLNAVKKSATDNKPIYVKLAADMNNDEIDLIVDACMECKIDGVVLTNLAKPEFNQEFVKSELNFYAGAMSGMPVQRISTRVVRYVYQRSRGKLTIIGVGGIFNAVDAYEKITSGASLVALVSALIFEGPQVIGEINRGLVKLLKKDGFNSISEAVGSQNPL